MPFVDVKLTKKLSSNQEDGLKNKIGEFISVFPGKSESWLMCKIADDKKIWFGGDNSSDSAFVEVKLFGAVDKNGANDFTAKICDYLESEIGIKASRVYVRYEGGTDWGWNGSNF